MHPIARELVIRLAIALPVTFIVILGFRIENPLAGFFIGIAIGGIVTAVRHEITGI